MLKCLNTVLISRVMCGCVIIVSLTFLIVCGFWLPVIMSTLCVASVILAVAINILFLEYAYILIVKTMRFKSNTNIEKDNEAVNRSEILERAESQREALYHKHGNLLFRPSLRTYYRGMNDEDVKVKVYSHIFRFGLKTFAHRKLNSKNWRNWTSSGCCRIWQCSVFTWQCCTL